MSPRVVVTVGDLAALVARGVRLDAACVTATGIVARVSHARCLAVVVGARRAYASSRMLGAVEAHVLGVLVDIEAADAVAELAPDEVCPCCDGNGWLETAEGHQIACELCDERGLVAIDATYHAHEEAYESLDAAIAAACEVQS